MCGGNRDLVNTLPPLNKNIGQMRVRIPSIFYGRYTAFSSAHDRVLCKNISSMKT